MSLDVLKLYRGEDVVRQNPKDIDPDRYTDDGELTELPEMPWRVHLPETHLEQEIEMDRRERRHT